MKNYKIKFKTIDEVIEFVNLCAKYKCDIDVNYGRYIIDAKSLVGIIAAGLNNEFEIVFHGDNENEELFSKELIKLSSKNKNE